MESLAELKELRERAEVNQEDAAAWIGVVRSTYTRKELNDLPTSYPEYALVKLKLELILEGKNTGEVSKYALIESEYTAEMCKQLNEIIILNNSQANSALRYGIRGVYSQIKGDQELKELMQKISGMERQLAEIERLLKTDAGTQKSVG